MKRAKWKKISRYWRFRAPNSKDWKFSFAKNFDGFRRNRSPVWVSVKRRELKHKCIDMYVRQFEFSCFYTRWKVNKCASTHCFVQRRRWNCANETVNFAAGLLRSMVFITRAAAAKPHNLLCVYILTLWLLTGWSKQTHTRGETKPPMTDVNRTSRAWSVLGNDNAAWRRESYENIFLSDWRSVSRRWDALRHGWESELIDSTRRSREMTAVDPLVRL